MSDYIYFLLVLIAPFIGKLANNLYTIYKLKKESGRSTDILRYMQTLTKEEFEIWACDFLCNNNFSDISTCPASICHCQNIICTKDNHTFYVLCKQYGNNESITNDDIDSLLGSMILDNVHKGIVFTTGEINNKIKNSLLSIPKDYLIQIITGEDLKYSLINKKTDISN